MPTVRQPASFASCPAICPTAPAAAETTTVSPGLNRGSLLSTTAPRFTDVMTSPISSDLAYERASLIRPRWYGSTEAYKVRTSASPIWGEPISTSSSAKSDSCGTPTGRAAKVMRRFSGMRLASQVVRLGFYMGYAPPGTNPLELIALAQEAERLGYDSAWAAEAW